MGYRSATLIPVGKKFAPETFEAVARISIGDELQLIPAPDGASMASGIALPTRK